MPLDITAIESARFWSYVRKTETCWIWTRPLRYGYGRIRYNGTDVLTHRLAYELAYGPIPPTMMVLHRCETLYTQGDRTSRSCARPDHLYLGTAVDNCRDRERSGHVARGERIGISVLTAGQVSFIRTLYGLGFGSYRDIGKKFNVNFITVRDIVKRRSWKYLH